MKIVTIVGARPQFIKAATISRVIAEYNLSILPAREPIQEVLVHTGQHYDENMSDIFFEELGIPFPAYNLGIGSANHGAQTGKMLEEIERVLLKELPDLVLVYGDTNSTLAGALAAAKLHIALGHVEAGLRSFNKKMPEEINRVLTDHIADILFAPSQTAVSNLQAESIPSKRIFLTGDVMYDASLYYYNLAREKSCILDTLNTDKYILATIHRAENTDNFNRMEEIFNGLIKMTENIPVILPLHPRTRESLKKYKLLDRVLNSIKVIPPVGYLDMAMLEKNATLIVTDSGGVQKESYFYEVPCLTVRDETEWIELVEAGWNRLVVPLTSDNLINHINEIQNSFRRPGSIAGYLGDGQAANIIMDLLLKFTNI